MNYRINKLSPLLALLLLFLLGSMALADQCISSTRGAESDGMNDIGELGAIVLSSEELDTVSGRQIVEIDKIDIQSSNMQLDADLRENTLYSNRTGLNIVTNDALTGANGIATVIQNSGNQVIINNALILNMTVE